MSQVTDQAWAYPGFLMMRLGVLLLPPWWDAYRLIYQYPFTHPGGERHCETYVSRPETQCRAQTQTVGTPTIRPLCKLLDMLLWITGRYLILHFYMYKTYLIIVDTVAHTVAFEQGLMLKRSQNQLTDIEMTAIPEEIF